MYMKPYYSLWESAAMRNPFNGRNRITQIWSIKHFGLDIVGDDNKTVRAVCAGKVIRSTIVTDHANPTWEWGNYVRVDGADGKRYYYCHLASRAVKAGQYVAEGQALGIMGHTGNSIGAHLHLQVRSATGKELNVADVLGVANKRGYIGAHDLPTLEVGPVSYGDRKSFEAMAASLYLPCSVLAKEGELYILAIGPMSAGDRATVEAMANALHVPCKVLLTRRAYAIIFRKKQQ